MSLDGSLQPFKGCIWLRKPFSDGNDKSFFCSSFDDIFDVDHFIQVLKDDVSIVRELPSKLSWSTREYYATGIRETRIKTAPVQASVEWYLQNVLPVLQRSVDNCAVIVFG